MYYYAVYITLLCTIYVYMCVCVRIKVDACFFTDR